MQYVLKTYQNRVVENLLSFTEFDFFTIIKKLLFE